MSWLHHHPPALPARPSSSWPVRWEAPCPRCSELVEWRSRAAGVDQTAVTTVDCVCDAGGAR